MSSGGCTSPRGRHGEPALLRLRGPKRYSILINAPPYWEPQSVSQAHDPAGGLVRLPRAPRGATRPGGMKGPTCGPSQRPAEAESSLTPEARGRAGAALTTPGRSGTTRRAGSGKRDGKVYECRNQRWNPLKRTTGPQPGGWGAGQQ